MTSLRFGVIGAGFWAPYQLAGWKEVEGAYCIALADKDRDKADRLAGRLGILAAYDDAREMFANERLDFVDIITDVDSHAPLVELAASCGVPAICQKPLAPSLEQAESMVEACRKAGVPLLVHENWRWQAPLRRLKRVLQSGRLGTIIRARIDYAHSFPVFDNQPFLMELEQFILTDVGTHILDVARFLWGEATELYCRTRRIHPDIRGEDVATVMTQMGDDVTVTCNMSYASRWEFDRFPETFVAIEGTRGGVTLGPDYTLKVFTDQGVEVRHPAPKKYPWANPAYALIHAGLVDCNRNLLQHLRGEAAAETTGEDNLKTLELVFAAYESAATGRAVKIGKYRNH